MTDPIVDDLLDLFPHTIGWQKHTGSDGRGKATYDALVNKTGRVSTGHQKIVRTSTGKEVTCTIMVTFASSFEAKALDRFTLPSPFNPTNPVAVAVTTSSDENGPHHDRVFFM